MSDITFFGLLRALPPDLVDEFNSRTHIIVWATTIPTGAQHLDPAGGLPVPLSNQNYGSAPAVRVVTLTPPQVVSVGVSW